MTARCSFGRRAVRLARRDLVKDGAVSKSTLCTLLLVSCDNLTLANYSTNDRLRSVNSLSWAPHELGPILACASSDGKVSVLSFGSTLFLKQVRFSHELTTLPLLPCPSRRRYLVSIYIPCACYRCKRRVMGSICDPFLSRCASPRSRPVSCFCRRRCTTSLERPLWQH